MPHSLQLSRRRLYPFLAVLGVLATSVADAQSASPAPLRVCADANNLPYSNAAGEGFENRLAELLAATLQRPLDYAWQPQRRGFIRNTLNAGRCDLVIGVPENYSLTATTAAYYRSSYVVVSRRGDNLDIHELDDPRLADLEIGIHTIGDDYANPPPSQLLALHGLHGNVHGYSLYGDYREDSPPARLIEAVARHDIDVAIAWGPVAGYFASRFDPPLRISVLRDNDLLPLSFPIAIGLRRDDDTLRRRVDAALKARKADIDSLLRQYHVPMPEPARASTAAAKRRND